MRVFFTGRLNDLRTIGPSDYQTSTIGQPPFIFSRPTGRAYATLLRQSSVCLSVMLCIVAKQCVLEQKLLLRAYRKTYMRHRLVPN